MTQEQVHGLLCKHCGHPQRLEAAQCVNWICPRCGETAGEERHGGVENGLLRPPGRGNAWPVCPCGGQCKPINTWRSTDYWLCLACGHKHATRPIVTKANDPVEGQLVLEQILKRRWADDSR